MWADSDFDGSDQTPSGTHYGTLVFINLWWILPGQGLPYRCAALVTACGKVLKAQSMMKDLLGFLKVGLVRRRLESARLC